MNPRALPALLCAVALTVTACSPDADEPAPEPETEAEPDPEPATAPLTGLPTDDPDLASRPVLAVKIDDAPRARPQTGLEAADIVYEERVEGGAVRFIGLFHSTVPEVVGPVRSARPVDVEILSGYDRPVLAYSGARDEVATLLADAPIVRITEGDAGFHRRSDRPAPHNLYLRAPEAVEAGAEAGAGGMSEATWHFAEEADGELLSCPPDAQDDCVEPGREVSVDVSPTTRTSFTWDEADGHYRRSEGGEPTEVTGSDEVEVTNVVILATRHYQSGCCDTAGQPYDDTEVLGDDRAVLLRDGRAYRAAWEKPSPEAPLRLVLPGGEPLPLAPGRTWVVLAPDDALPYADLGDVPGEGDGADT